MMQQNPVKIKIQQQQNKKKKKKRPGIFISAFLLLDQLNKIIMKNICSSIYLEESRYFDGRI
jgi:hypothetical protein